METNQTIPKWILIVSAILALLEITVSISLFAAPEMVFENADITAKGVLFLIYMWASRQFALGIITAYATLKKSLPMLKVVYVFFAVMFLGDIAIGISQKENGMIGASAGMLLFVSAILFSFSKKK